MKNDNCTHTHYSAAYRLNKLTSWTSLCPVWLNEIYFHLTWKAVILCLITVTYRAVVSWQPHAPAESSIKKWNQSINTCPNKSFKQCTMTYLEIRVTHLHIMWDEHKHDTHCNLLVSSDLILGCHIKKTKHFLLTSVFYFKQSVSEFRVY